MEIEKNINRVINYWANQNILITQCPEKELNHLLLPNDFKQLYVLANGMSGLYPNENDKEGFLFYPVDFIVSVSEIFDESNIRNKDNILIFADYLLKCWWYGVEVREDMSYTIGIIPSRNTFKPITNSLQEFLEYYLEDSPILYDY